MEDIEWIEKLLGGWQKTKDQKTGPFFWSSIPDYRNRLHLGRRY
jgi:hypothetical protein